jgi:putative DNA primase/helicase
MKHEFNFDPLTAEELANAPHIEPEEVKEVIIPVPESALPLRFKHPAYGEPVQIWPYHDGNGQLVGYKALFKDENGRKHYYPLTFCKTGNKQKWRAEGFPAPYPLYNAINLATRRDAPVIVVRGERNADAAQILFPQFVATTSPFGDGLFGRADWSALDGRDVLVLECPH